MQRIDQYRNGEITLEELLKQAESDPALAEEIKRLGLGEKLSEDELDKISAAGVLHGDMHSDYM